MRYKKFGSTGMDVSVLCLGTWALGGKQFGAVTQEDAVAAVHAMIDCGVNIVDTAPIYASGGSEEILGKALRIVIRSLRLVNLYENIRSSSLAEVVCEVVLHVNDEETQEQCMEVMSLLVANSEATHEVFTRRDVVSIVVDNMRVCFQNRLMNESCCMALAFLTRYSEVVDYVSMVSIAKLVMESMRHYKSSKNVMYCALCVTNISVNESCCKELIENEAVQTLLSLCDGFMTEEDMLGAITSALYCLSLDERSHAIFGASRCVEVFTQVMGMWTKRTNDEILCNIFL